ncbi:MAG: hypothetical protein K2X66_08875 [Cyanobacteria bacterium]|nr:hypothetical protein [Cyanobacteriota bacterium]
MIPSNLQLNQTQLHLAGEGALANHKIKLLPVQAQTSFDTVHFGSSPVMSHAELVESFNADDALLIEKRFTPRKAIGFFRKTLKFFPLSGYSLSHMATLSPAVKTAVITHAPLQELKAQIKEDLHKISSHSDFQCVIDTYLDCYQDILTPDIMKTTVKELLESPDRSWLKALAKVPGTLELFNSVLEGIQKIGLSPKAVFSFFREDPGSLRGMIQSSESLEPLLTFWKDALKAGETEEAMKSLLKGAFRLFQEEREATFNKFLPQFLNQFNLSESTPLVQQLPEGLEITKNLFSALGMKTQFNNGVEAYLASQLKEISTFLEAKQELKKVNRCLSQIERIERQCGLDPQDFLKSQGFTLQPKSCQILRDQEGYPVWEPSISITEAFRLGIFSQGHQPPKEIEEGIRRVLSNPEFKHILQEIRLAHLEDRNCNPSLFHDNLDRALAKVNHFKEMGTAQVIIRGSRPFHVTVWKNPRDGYYYARDIVCHKSLAYKRLLKDESDCTIFSDTSDRQGTTDLGCYRFGP